MPMNTAALMADLVRDEGRVDHAYQDSEGYWTIGVGHLIDKRRGGALPGHIIDLLLDYDAAMAVADLDRNVPWWRDMPEPWQRGLANMAFNLGWPTLSRFKKMLAALEAGDGETAAREAGDSKWAQQVGDRATRIQSLYRETQ